MKNLTILSLLCAVISLSSYAARDFSDVEITTLKVAGNVYMLKGSGGNIGVLATPEGLLLVDDQFAPLASKIEQAMEVIDPAPLKYIVNTHYHGDHTGSNAHFAKQAPIFAHHNVRKRVAEDNKKQGSDLPVVTYEDGVTIYLADETITLTHMPMGHTDGDSVVYFKKANVLHTGDLYFQGRFPYIDLNAGGTVKGYLTNVKNMVKQFPSDAQVIPGHGELSNMDGLKQFIAMLEYSVARVETALQKGSSKEDIIAAGIGDEYKVWAWQFISEERWLTTLVDDLSKK
jgi:glyoxylase-like metal-dependent hydrolase (beta-lactamase superfamily II)